MSQQTLDFNLQTVSDVLIHGENIPTRQNWKVAETVGSVHIYTGKIQNAYPPTQKIHAVGRCAKCHVWSGALCPGDNGRALALRDSYRHMPYTFCESEDGICPIEIEAECNAD